ncbi:hypothetical protein GCM10028784_39460 [Myceligenerans cantabricum]
MNHPTPRHAATGPTSRATAGVIPAESLDRLSDDEQVTLRCPVAELPGTEANVVITRTGGRFTVALHPVEPAPITASDARPASCTMVEQDGRYVLATGAANGPDAARRWLTALRTGHAAPQAGSVAGGDASSGLDPADVMHVRTWILAHAPEGLFTATTELGTGIGIANPAAPGDEPSVAMLTDTHLVTRGPDTTALSRLRSLIAGWRRAGSPHTGQIEAVVFRDDDGYRVRLIVPESGARG